MKPLDLSKLPSFLRGYFQAALFTTDPNPPGGCDYVECGRAADMTARIPEDFRQQAAQDCNAFQQANREDLDEWLDMLRSDGYDEASAGSDFWYSRNGHGTGYFDRSTGSGMGDTLQEAARKWGEVYLELGGWWENEYRCACGEHWTRPEDAGNDPTFGEDVCDACGATVDSENRKRGEHMQAIDEPAGEPATA